MYTVTNVQYDARLLWRWRQYIFASATFSRSFLLISQWMCSSDFQINDVLHTAWFMIHSRVVGCCGTVSLQAPKEAGNHRNIFFHLLCSTKSLEHTDVRTICLLIPMPMITLQSFQTFKKLYKASSVGTEDGGSQRSWVMLDLPSHTMPEDCSAAHLSFKSPIFLIQ